MKNGSGLISSIGVGVPVVATSCTVQLLLPQHNKVKSSILVNQDVLGWPSLHNESFSRAERGGRCVAQQRAGGSSNLRHVLELAVCSTARCGTTACCSCRCLVQLEQTCGRRVIYASTHVHCGLQWLDVAQTLVCGDMCMILLERWAPSRPCTWHAAFELRVAADAGTATASSLLVAADWLTGNTVLLIFQTMLT